MSEQYLMDCGWDTGNTACMGGFQDLAFQWVLAHGGIASEAEYPYQGVSQGLQCRVVRAHSPLLGPTQNMVPGDLSRVLHAMRALPLHPHLLSM